MLPFQILYDQGVITGFVWQVVLKEQFLSQNLVTLFSTISWHLPQSMIWKNMNKNWNFFATPCNSACFQFVGIPWKGWIGIKSFWSTVTCCLAHWDTYISSEYFENIFRSTLPHCLVISGSTRMPWPLLPSLTGWICSFKLCNRFVSRIHSSRYFTYNCLESDQFLQTYENSGHRRVCWTPWSTLGWARCTTTSTTTRGSLGVPSTRWFINIVVLQFSGNLFMSDSFILKRGWWLYWMIRHVQASGRWCTWGRKLKSLCSINDRACFFEINEGKLINSLLSCDNSKVKKKIII